MKQVKRLLKRVKHLPFDDRLTALYESFGGLIPDAELELLAKKGA